jgi:hypothetical protein
MSAIDAAGVSAARPSAEALGGEHARSHAAPLVLLRHVAEVLERLVDGLIEIDDRDARVDVALAVELQV